MKVYLSGGMRSGWQDRVKKNCPDIDFIDPRAHGLGDPDQYTLWDLLGVSVCDILFAYMEDDNPSGFGLTFEVGYAKALGKRIVLVDEQMHKYMAIVRASADVVLSSLDEGIELLCSLNLLYE